MNVWPVVALLTTIAALAAGGYAVYLRVRASKYTRERYAFALLALTLPVLMLVSSALTAADPPWIAVISLVAEYFGLAYRPSSPGMADKILFVASVYYVMKRLHDNFTQWPGAVSVRQHERQAAKEQDLYLIEGAVELRRIIRREQPFERYDHAGYRFDMGRTDTSSCSYAWKDVARDLVTLLRPWLRFDPVTGWHDEHRLWIGENIKTGEVVGLACPSGTADFVGTRVADYLRQFAGDGAPSLLVASKHPLAPSSETGLAVEVMVKDEMLDALVDFTDYFEHITGRVERECLPDTKLTHRDVYVPSRLLGEDGSVIAENLETYVGGWLDEAQGRHLAILGEYGQGKSTGALMFTYHQIQRQNRRRIPVLIELRGKSPSTLQPRELMGAWASLYGIDPRAMMRLHEAGRLVLIFDGFDEMADAATLEARANHFAALWRFDHPQSKLIFTGRQNFFLEGELRKALKIERGVAAGSYCDALRLAFFSTDQMAQSLRNAAPDVREEILDLAGHDPHFFDVVARPSLLYLVTVLWRTPDFQQAQGIMNSGSVLRLFIRHLYRRQTEKARLSPSNFMVLNEDERAYFMDGVAAFMAVRDLPNQIARDDFEGAVRRLYHAYPDCTNGSDERIMREPFKVRLADRPDAMEAVITDVRTYGLLVDDPSRPGALRFPHKSFLETLQAQCAANGIRKRVSPEMRAIVEATKFGTARSLAARQVLLLCADMIQSSHDDVHSLGELGSLRGNTLISIAVISTRYGQYDPHEYGDSWLISIRNIGPVIAIYSILYLGYVTAVIAEGRKSLSIEPAAFSIFAGLIAMTIVHQARQRLCMAYLQFAIYHKQGLSLSEFERKVGVLPSRLLLSSLIRAGFGDMVAEMRQR